MWAWGDLMNGLQIFPNLVGVVGLSGVVAALLRRDEASATRRRGGAALSGFERVGEELRCDGVSLEDAAREHGTPLYVYSRAGIEAAFRAYEAAFAPAAAPDLLRGQGQRQRRDPAPARRARGGGRHRVRGRAARRPARRLPAGAHRLRRGGQDATPRSPSASSTGSASGTRRARTRSGGSAPRPPRAARWPGSPCASTPTSTRGRTRTSRPACARRSSASTSRLAPGILRRSREQRRGRDRGPAVPHRLADHRPRAAGGGGAGPGRPQPAAAGRGLPAADDRPRRRPRA